MNLQARIFSREWTVTWGLLLAACTLIGLLNASIVWTSKLAEGHGESPAFALAMELTGSWTAFLLLPFILWLMTRFPIQRENWAVRLAMHLAATIPVGVVHTLLMWGSRQMLYSLLGWGAYDYGLMRYRFPMEYQKQFLYYWAIYATVATVRYVRRNRERELQASRLKQQLTEARLDALKMQLNPHFLFNTLNMISSYVRSDPAVADTMITRLSDFLRMTLRHSGLHEVPLRKEVGFLGAYVEIMKARFQEKLQVDITIIDETRSALLPHMILQPLVENSVTHCTRRQGSVGRVSVSSSRANGRLRVSVEDNGPGIEGDPSEAVGRGVGLTNTAGRLEALYGSEHTLEMENLPGGGLRLIMEVPWRTEAEDEEASE